MLDRADVAQAMDIQVHRVGIPSHAFTADSLHGKPAPPRLWHVPGMIPASQVTLLSGEGGVGKSTLMLQLCCATALECDWIGQAPRGGRALYLNAEDESDEIHRRLDALSVFYGQPLSNLRRLMAWPLADQQDAALVLADGRTEGIRPTPLWAEFAAAVRSWRPALVVIDAVADVFAGDENNRGQVRKFVALNRSLAIETGAAIVLLSHPSLSGLSTGSGLSGSTAWNNSVRSRLYFSRPKQDPDSDADPDLRTLSVLKANYARSGAELRLRLRAGGFADESNGGLGALDLAVALDRIDAQFIELLISYCAQKRPVSDLSGRNYAPKFFAQDPRAAGTTKAAFHKSMLRLLADRRIEVALVGPPSRQRRELAVTARCQ